MKKMLMALFIILILLGFIVSTSFALEPPHIENAIAATLATEDEYNNSYFSEKYNTPTIDEYNKYVKITFYDTVGSFKLKYGVILPYTSTTEAGLENIPQTAGYFLENNSIQIRNDSKEFVSAKVDIENKDTFIVQITYEYDKGNLKEGTTVTFSFNKSIFTNL